MVDHLDVVLDRSRALGLLGPGPLDAHVDHARAFVAAWRQHRDAPPTQTLDLGSGGGVPGLVLALEWPQAHVTLLEAAQRRCDFLTWAVRELDLEASVAVLHARAEDGARDPALAGSFDLVTARSFGPPATTAECAARFLAPDGLLLVSEPPGEDSTTTRWPSEGLRQLGFGPARLATGTPRIVVIQREDECPETFPRRDGVPAKRPLF